MQEQQVVAFGKQRSGIHLPGPAALTAYNTIAQRRSELIATIGTATIDHDYLGLIAPVLQVLAL